MPANLLRRRNRWLAPAVALLMVFSTACDEPADAEIPAAALESGALNAEPATPTTAQVDYVHDLNAPYLPAYNARRFGPNKGKNILQPLKGDQFDDIRNAYPENYAITAPPSGNFRAMVEWEPMHAIVMSYSSDMIGASNASDTIANIALHASTVADVWFLVQNQAAINALTTRMLDAGMTQAAIDDKVYFFDKANIDSVWFIDSGPMPIVDTTNNTYAFADFRYYHQRAWDDGVPTVLGRNLVDFGLPSNTETYRMPLNTEGGTFQATSDGICFTGTRQLYYMECPTANCPNNIEYLPLNELQEHPLTLEIEASWGPYLGCQDVVVTYSVTDDGTGHIDMYMKVVDDDTVLMGQYNEPYGNQAQQENAGRLDANAAFIDAYVKPDGSTMNTARLVMPGHRTDQFGSIPFTYINSTFINGLNLWPATEYANWVPSRNQAQATWEAVMPDYTHQYIDSTQLSFWSGAIHCITRTIPAGTPAQWVGEGTCGSDDVCAPPTGGYDGGCSPGVSDADICYGPEWECACNNCALCGDEPVDPPDPPGTECDGITWQGCCDGDTLKWCQGGQLQTQSCPFFFGCGWNGGDGYYNCGGTGEDPTGANPIACPSPCTPDCSGKTCGDDGCGGSCGTCGEGETCGASGTCEDDPQPPGPDAGGGADSGGGSDAGGTTDSGGPGEDTAGPGEDTAGPGQDAGPGSDAGADAGYGSDAGAGGEVALDGGTPPPGVNPIQSGNASGCASTDAGPDGAIGFAVMLLVLAAFRRRRAV